MSTELYAFCQEHQEQSEEIGQHLHSLNEAREFFNERDLLVQAFRAYLYPDGELSRSHAQEFFAAHPGCPLGIRDENGRDHQIIPPDGQQGSA